jgi:AraC-like DNA-binding protein/transposase-like protein
LRVIRAEVLNKTAESCHPKGTGASVGQAYGRLKNLLSLWRRQVTEASNPVGVQRQVQLRDSKQPGRSSAWNSIASNAREKPIVGLSERVYESTTLAALFDVLVPPRLPSPRNFEKREPRHGRGALSEIKDFARGIDDGLQERNSPPHASATRRPTLRLWPLCDDLLKDLKSRTGIAGEIRALLFRDITNPPTLAAIAKLLQVSDRSLRRQLREQGISFRGLLDELRMQIALKYLRTTRLANEDIALVPGFSDAANFRRISPLDEQITQRDQRRGPQVILLRSVPPKVVTSAYSANGQVRRTTYLARG